MSIPSPHPGERDRVLIELTPEPESSRTVLAAALSLFDATVDVVLWQRDRPPTAAQATVLGQLCEELAGGVPAPVIDLVDAASAQAMTARVSVQATGDAMADARAVVLMVAVAFERWGMATPPAPSPMAQLLAERDAAMAARDLVRDRSRQMVVVIAQVQSTWGAVATVCQALQADPRVELEVVAIESEHEQTALSTADRVRELGYEPRDAQWFADQLADHSGPLAAVLFYDPWDGLRSEPVRSVDVADAGVRIAYVPYGTSVGAGEHIEQMAYDLAMHRLAWRIFVRSEQSKTMFGRWCAAGADHVRVTGSPKMDQVVDLSTVTPLSLPPSAVRVLWNPHFTFGPEGWSTFDRYLQPMLEYAAQHPALCLVVRPHFRLVRDLPRNGGPGAALFEALLQAPQRLRNVVVDLGPDYLPTFAAVDAMVSDLSSLIPEFVVSGKPVCYLHRTDGPGANEDAEYFFEGPVATDWAGVKNFLDHLMGRIKLVRAGCDVGAQGRQLLIDRHFPLADGQAGARVAAEIVDQLLLEQSELLGGIDALVR